MVEVKREGVILERSDLMFESHSVLNPAVMQEGNTLHLYYRAVRHGNFSTIGYCKLDGPTTIVERSDMPVIFSQFDYESHGVEDPRIVRIDDLYYITFTAYDGVNALGVYATSKDLIHFEKHGLMVPLMTYTEFKRLAEFKTALPEKYVRFNKPLMDKTRTKKTYVWDKNVVFFPRRINGKLCFLHRVKPDIQFVAVSELSDLTQEFWDDYFMHLAEHVVMGSHYDHEVSYIGGGCPPIETEHGWLVIYHGVCDTVSGYVYSACAALLDLENPLKELARLPYPLLKPENDYEMLGAVHNVVFPSGTAVFGDRLYIYYGGADEVIACASVSMNELVNELLTHRTVKL